MHRPDSGGVTLPQLAVLADWAEQRLMLVSMEAQLEKVMLLVIDDPPVARAIKEALMMARKRTPLRERLQNPDSMPEMEHLVADFNKPGAVVTTLRPVVPMRRPAPLPRPAPPSVTQAPVGKVTRKHGGTVNANRITEGAPTNRELEILQLVADGYSNSRIGEALTVSENTVKTHLHRMTTRYSMNDRASLVAMAMRKEWIK